MKCHVDLLVVGVHVPASGNQPAHVLNFESAPVIASDYPCEEGRRYDPSSHPYLFSLLNLRAKSFFGGVGDD